MSRTARIKLDANPSMTAFEIHFKWILSPYNSGSVLESMALNVLMMVTPGLI